MKIKRTFIIGIVVASVMVFLLSFASQAEAQVPPDKDEAAKLLTSMGYTNVVVAAVIPGLGNYITKDISAGEQRSFCIASPSLCSVVGTCNFKGKNGVIQQTFYFDKTEGWFLWWEIDGAVQMINKNGSKLIVSNKTEAAK